MTLIDKDKLIRELRINPAGCEECEYADSKLNCTRGFQFASACESICEAVEIDAEPVKHAKDIYYEEKNWHCEFKCSLCKATIGVVEAGDLDGANFKYCPNCGARLDLEEVGDENG